MWDARPRFGFRLAFDLAWLMEFFERSTDRLRTVFKLALHRATAQQHGSIHPGHLLFGFSEEGKGLACRVLSNLNVAKGELERRTLTMLAGIPHSAASQLDVTTPLAMAPFNEETLELMNATARVSSSLNHNYFGTEHLCVAFFDVGSTKNLLEEFGITREQVADELSRLFGYAP